MNLALELPEDWTPRRTYLATQKLALDGPVDDGAVVFLAIMNAEGMEGAGRSEGDVATS